MPTRHIKKLAVSLCVAGLMASAAVPAVRGQEKKDKNNQELLKPGTPGHEQSTAEAAPMTPEQIKAAGERATKAGEKLGWRIGVQAWTFNNRSLFETIDQVHKLGLHYLEAFPGQALDNNDPALKAVKMGPEMPAEAKEALKKKLAENDIKLVSFGVTGIPADEAGARKFFQWAKEMGLETIVSEPAENQFDVLNKLVDEFGINVAIHDHPKPSHYWNPDTVLKVVEGRSKRIGSCADVGHWQRSGVPPIEALKKLRGRIIESHFKDLNKFDAPGAVDVPWGTGTGDAKGMLAEIHRQDAKIVFLVEYEHFSRSLVNDVARSVDFFGLACEELAAGKNRKNGKNGKNEQARK